MSAAGASFTCPADGTPLVMSERQGIEVDYCPSCRGVWLDRGELDKIIQRSLSEGDERASARPAQTPLQEPGWRPDRDPHHYRHKRRKSFLQDLFD